jgi:hypothetical protein
LDISSLENCLLLIQYSLQLPKIANCSVLIYVLFKSLETKLLLDSENSMQLWTHAKFCVEEDPRWKDVRKDIQKAGQDALVKLTEHKVAYFRHYQRYVEEPDRQKINNLHQLNGHLQCMVSEFVSWYCNGDLKRVGNLFETARAIGCCEIAGRILSQLHEEMVDFQQMDTFEACSTR